MAYNIKIDRAAAVDAISALKKVVIELERQGHSDDNDMDGVYFGLHCHESGALEALIRALEDMVWE